MRWLSAVMGGLMVVGVAGIVQQPLLLIASPMIAGLFLLAPPIGIYRHDESPVELTRVHLEATPMEREDLPAVTFRITLVNDGDVAAEDFRIRLLVPIELVPAEATNRMLGVLHVGSIGRHWFTETTYTATAITFRAGRAGDPDAITCAPGSRGELIDLLLPTQRAPYDVLLDYQVNGGTVSATLSQVRLRSA